MQRLAASHDERKILHDLAVVLTWAGRNDEAIRLYEQRDLARDAVDYVDVALARAYRAQKNFDVAERMARAAVQRQPGDSTRTVFLALVLIDRDRANEAEALLAALLQREPANAEAWRARGYAMQALGDPFKTLRAYAEAARLDPGNAESARGMAQVLLQLGAPHAAAGGDTRAPLAIRARQAGAHVRWAAQIPATSLAQTFDATDAALSQLDTLIAEARATRPVDASTLRALLGDRAVALRQRERWQQTVDAVAALRADGPIPPYVRLAEADALLALQRPDEARRAYQDVVDSGTLERDARIGRFFAEVEAEDFTAAFATVDALAATGGPRRETPGRARAEPNSDWLDAQILAANARQYADMNADAWARLLPLAQGAPALGYLRAALGAVAAARGWPRRADEEIRVAASLSPDDRGIRIALADSALRRRDIAAATSRATELAGRFPDDPAVQRLTRDLALEGMREFRVEAAQRREYGSANAAPGGGSRIAARLYSAPFAENWRAIAAAERSTATPPEGRVVRDRAGAGAEYRGADTTLELLAWDNRGSLSRAGASAIGSWHADDYRSVYAGIEAYAADTPLRAQRYGITANAADLGAEFRWHESTSLAAAVRALDFSDGNRRQSVRAVFTQRVIDRPHFDLTLRPEIYASRNSRVGAPYFNPASDRAATIALETEHVIWRRYDNSWTQRLSLSGGSYRQEGFAAGGIYTLTYEQRYRFNPACEIRYGIESNRRIYDGTPERAVTAFIGLNKKF